METNKIDVTTPITTYAQAQQFIYDHFMWFNGKINTILPAKYLVFEQNIDDAVVGDNLGDIININLVNIIKTKNANNFDDKAFKGYMLYILIHELLHLDQDLKWYFKRYDDVTAIEELEIACHVMTFYTLNKYQYNMIVGYGKDYFHIPRLSSFINCDDSFVKSYDTFKEYLNANLPRFKMIKDPLDKALMVLSTGLYGEKSKLTKLMKNIKKYMNVIIEIILNGKLVDSKYLKYLHKFMYWRDIFDIYRLIVLFTKQQNATNINKVEGKVSNIMIEFWEAAEGSGGSITGIYSIRIEGNLDIFYKFQNQPFINSTLMARE